MQQSFCELIDLLHLVLKQLLCISAVLEIALLSERANVSDSGLNSLVFTSELGKNLTLQDGFILLPEMLEH